MSTVTESLEKGKPYYCGATALLVGLRIGQEDLYQQSL